MCTPLSATSQLVAFLLCPNKLWFNPGGSIMNQNFFGRPLQTRVSCQKWPTSRCQPCYASHVWKRLMCYRWCYTSRPDVTWQRLLYARFFILYLRDVSALVASLQQTGNEIPKEIQVLFWQGFLQLLDTEDTVNQHVKKLQALSKR